MAKVIVNNQTVVAGKKEKLTKHMSRMAVKQLVKDKQKEQKGEQS